VLPFSTGLDLSGLIQIAGLRLDVSARRQEMRLKTLWSASITTSSAT